MAAAASSSMAATATVTGTGSSKVCFNSNCKIPLERPRKGWRRRTGEFADLCDSCASAHDEGNFCETFHLNSSGWRCCESCGKQIHCGCIVSFHMFVLLDAGGIECITCARKSFILTPNPAWPPPSLFLPLQSERIKDMPVRSWSSIAGSGPVPWRQAPSLFNGALVQPELHSRLPVEVDRLRFNERLSSSSLEKRKLEDSFDRLLNGSPAISRSEVLGGGTPVANGEERPASLSHSQQMVNSMTSGFSLAMASASKPEIDDHTVIGIPMPRPTLSSQAEKRPCSQNQVDVAEAQLRNGKAKGDVRGRSQMLERYRPQISEEELLKISEDSNSVVTPLFEKTLSASDAGRIGRLVLPKKCAETYFPPISHPEGLPLKVQDLKGKEWIFQFRFWPNNNSRMYVLEGITPCIQSMQLQAGDIVTFSRIEPEGKLVMGCRKASAASSEKGNETFNGAVNKSSINGETVAIGCKGVENAKAGEVTPANLAMHGNAASPSLPPLNQQTRDPASIWSEADKPGHVVVKTNSSARGKRKNNTVGLKRKRPRIDSDDALKLEVSWTEVQGLFRSHSNTDPNIFMIEDCEFEEFEQDAPVIGRPTIPQSEHHGKKVQWVQCEKCLKWRKVPVDALLQLKWTCSENVWDTARSLCSTDEELTAEKLESLLPTMSYVVAAKIKDPLPDYESVDDALEGLDALANLAIQEKAASLQATTRHPRHKAGCSCIVCIQPPSGKGPKHKQPCDCVVCKSVKRRWETLMLKREQKQSEKEPETRRQKLQTEQSPEDSLKIDTNRSSKEEGSSDECTDNADELCPSSPLKGQIDLNIHPDREEDPSAKFYPGSRSDTLLDSKDRCHKQQRLSERIRGSMDSSSTFVDTKERHQKRPHVSEHIKNSQVNQTQPDGIGHANISKSVSLDNHKSIDLYPYLPSSKGIAASTTPYDG